MFLSGCRPASLNSFDAQNGHLADACVEAMLASWKLLHRSDRWNFVAARSVRTARCDKGKW